MSENHAGAPEESAVESINSVRRHCVCVCVCVCMGGGAGGEGGGGRGRGTIFQLRHCFRKSEMLERKCRVSMESAMYPTQRTRSGSHLSTVTSCKLKVPENLWRGLAGNMPHTELCDTALWGGRLVQVPSGFALPNTFEDSTLQGVCGAGQLLNSVKRQSGETVVQLP